MIFQPLSQKSTFENSFVTKAVTLHVSELLALCNFCKSAGYIQPNVNHHFINENSSFEDLDRAFKSAIKGETTVSTEYDAVLTRKEELKPDSVQLQLPTYNVVTEKKADEVVVVVDSRVFEGLVTKLPSLKEKIACFKKETIEVKENESFGKGGIEVSANENVIGEDGNFASGKTGENGVLEQSDENMEEGGPAAESQDRGTEEKEAECEDGTESKVVDVENNCESESSILSVDAVNVETELESGYSKTFLLFIEEMRTINEGLCLSFLDGLHRSYSLVTFASKSEENFQAVLFSTMNVSINFYVLKPNDNLIPKEPHLSEIEKDLEWYENIFSFNMVDIEIVLSLTQDKSGNLMLTKKATVGHTVLDAYSVLSRSVRNNSVNVYFSSATYQINIKKRKTWKHVLLDYNTGKDNHLHLEELTTKLFLEKFFKNFFFNNGFEEWAKQGLPLKLRRDLIKEDGRYNIKSLFGGVSYVLLCFLFDFILLIFLH